MLTGALDAIVDFAAAHPEYGLYGGRTLRPDGRVDPSSCWGAPTLWSLTSLRAGPLDRLPAQSSCSIPSRSAAGSATPCARCRSSPDASCWSRRDHGTASAAWTRRSSSTARTRSSRCAPAIAVFGRSSCPSAVIVHEVGGSTESSGLKMCMVMAGKVTLLRRAWTPLAGSRGRRAAAGRVGTARRARTAPWLEAGLAHRVGAPCATGATDTRTPSAPSSGGPRPGHPSSREPAHDPRADGRGGACVPHPSTRTRTTRASTVRCRGSACGVRDLSYVRLAVDARRRRAPALAEPDLPVGPSAVAGVRAPRVLLRRASRGATARHSSGVDGAQRRGARATLDAAPAIVVPSGCCSRTSTASSRSRDDGVDAARRVASRVGRRAGLRHAARALSRRLRLLHAGASRLVSGSRSPTGVTLVLTIGQVRPYKNVPHLIRTFAEVDDADAVLAVAGKPSTPALERRSAMPLRRIRASSPNSRSRPTSGSHSGSWHPTSSCCHTRRSRTRDRRSSRSRRTAPCSSPPSAAWSSSPTSSAPTGFARTTAPSMPSTWPGASNGRGHLEPARVDLSALDWSSIARDTVAAYEHIRSGRAPAHLSNTIRSESRDDPQPTHATGGARWRAAAAVVAATLLAIPFAANAEPDLPAGTYAVAFDSERQGEQLVAALDLAPKKRFAAAFDGVTVAAVGTRRPTRSQPTRESPVSRSSRSSRGRHRRFRRASARSRPTTRRSVPATAPALGPGRRSPSSTRA